MEEKSKDGDYQEKGQGVFILMNLPNMSEMFAGWESLLFWFWFGMLCELAMEGSQLGFLDAFASSQKTIDRLLSLHLEIDPFFFLFPKCET